MMVIPCYNALANLGPDETDAMIRIDLIGQTNMKPNIINDILLALVLAVFVLPAYSLSDSLLNQMFGTRTGRGGLCAGG